MVKRNGGMAGRFRLPLECSMAELDRELIARGARAAEEKRFNFRDRDGTPQRDDIMAGVKELYAPAKPPFLNDALAHLDTRQLFEALIDKAGQAAGSKRGIWGSDDRVDMFCVDDERVRNNAECTAAVCLKGDLIDTQDGFFSLKVKNFRETFNLCDCEPFCEQPIAAGPLCSGFLVNDDVVATAAHFVNGRKIEDLRFVFGYRMQDDFTPVIQIPHENIYNGVRIIDKVYKRLDRGGSSSGADWALLQLECRVEGRAPAQLSKDNICCGRATYVLGHPCGLPLKYAPGAQIRTISDAYFSADLDVYSSSSGSPVFDSDTHQVVGMVVRGDNRDFRWTGSCWLSVIYPDREILSPGPQCTRISEFRHYCRTIDERK